MAIFQYEQQALERRLPTEALDFFDDALLDACREAVEHFSIRELQPIALDTDWSVSDALTDFARHVRLRSQSPRTALSYVREAEVFARYLRSVRSRALKDAVEDDFWAYRAHRTQGPLNLRVKPPTWNRICAALLRLARFLQLKFDNLDWRSFKGSREDDDVHVRIIGLETYIRFRDVGLGHGRHSQRNQGFAELGVTTGMRCMENAALLRREMPTSASFNDANTRELALSEKITKGCKFRNVRVSRRVIRDYVEPYIQESRAHWVERALQRDFPKRVYSVDELNQMPRFIFFESYRSDKVRVLTGAGSWLSASLGDFNPRERSRLVEVRPHRSGKFEVFDLGPLWVSERGGCPTAASWHSTFSAACVRMGDGTHVTPLIQRHVFAVNHLHFSMLALQELRRARGPVGRRGEVYDRIVGDPLRVLQRLMGHASIKSTYKYLRFTEDHKELVERAFEQWDEQLEIRVS